MKCKKFLHVAASRRDRRIIFLMWGGSITPLHQKNYRINVMSPFRNSKRPSLNLAIILYAYTAGFISAPRIFPSHAFVGSPGRKFLATKTKFPQRSKISIDSISSTSDAALINNRSLMPSPFGEKTFGM